jgi:hypothetical protein
VVLGALCSPNTAGAPPPSSRKAKKRRGGGSPGAAAAPPAAPVEFDADSQSCSAAAVRAALLGLLCDALRPALGMIADDRKPATGLCRLHFKAVCAIRDGHVGRDRPSVAAVRRPLRPF